MVTFLINLYTTRRTICIVVQSKHPITSSRHEGDDTSLGKDHYELLQCSSIYDTLAHFWLISRGALGKRYYKNILGELRRDIVGKNIRTRLQIALYEMWLMDINLSFIYIYFT